MTDFLERIVHATVTYYFGLRVSSGFLLPWFRQRWNLHKLRRIRKLSRGRTVGWSFVHRGEVPEDCTCGEDAEHRTPQTSRK